MILIIPKLGYDVMMQAVKLKNKVNSAWDENPVLANMAFERVKYFFDKLNDLHKMNVEIPAFEPVVFFDKSTTAGYVWRSRFGNRIFLNWTLLKENTTSFMMATIPHEVCHIFQYVMDPNSSNHGRTWKKLMYSLGIEPRVYHSYNTENSRAKRRKFLYSCRCRNHEVGLALHKKLQHRGSMICATCAEKPKFVEEV